MTLTEFLLARIVEDEGAAHAALPGPWRWENIGRPDGEHIARHAPDRVLAECAARRAIVEMHTGPHECPTPESSCGWCVDSDECDTCRAFALPYADHPDFDPAWSL